MPFIFSFIYLSSGCLVYNSSLQAKFDHTRKYDDRQIARQRSNLYKPTTIPLSDIHHTTDFRCRESLVRSKQQLCVIIYRVTHKCCYFREELYTFCFATFCNYLHVCSSSFCVHIFYVSLILPKILHCILVYHILSPFPDIQHSSFISKYPLSFLYQIQIVSILLLCILVSPILI